MAAEHDFMKSSKEKDMTDEEYKPLRAEYDKKAEEMGERIKKTLTAFFVVLAVSFIALYIFSTVNKEAGNYTWLAVELLMAIFLYGVKAEDDKRNKYETDKRLLLKYAQNKIQAYKIRLGLVIGFGTAFAVINIICWWVAVTLYGGSATS